jgi:hypothetical protein
MPKAKVNPYPNDTDALRDAFITFANEIFNDDIDTEKYYQKLTAKYGAPPWFFLTDDDSEAITMPHRVRYNRMLVENQAARGRVPDENEMFRLVMHNPAVQDREGRIYVRATGSEVDMPGHIAAWAHAFTSSAKHGPKLTQKGFKICLERPEKLVDQAIYFASNKSVAVTETVHHRNNANPVTLVYMRASSLADEIFNS